MILFMIETCSMNVFTLIMTFVTFLSCIYLFFSLDSVDIHHDAAAVETRTAPYGSTVVMDCRTDLEPPVDFSWSKQGGALPRDSNTRDVSWLNDAVYIKPSTSIIHVTLHGSFH
jgi:hypothetical protein